MLIRAIIFDLEGTITKSESLFNALENILSRHQASANSSLQKIITGSSTEKAASILKKTYELPESPEELRELIHVELEKVYTKVVPFYAGFLPFFEKIGVLHYKYAIATNTPKNLLDQLKTTPPLTELFDSHIYTPESTSGKRKPEPDLYLVAADQLGVPPTECIAIEDSIPGVTAAKNAGMFCIRLTTTIETFEKVAGEDIVVSGFDEIPLEKLTK